MRHTLIILLLLLSPAVHHASAAGVGASPAQEAFDSAYSADVQRVKVSASGEFLRSVRPLPPLLQGADGRYPEMRIAPPYCCAASRPAAPADQGNGHEKISIVSPEFAE